MHKDVHLAALRAASKVAFSVAFIAGCSSSSEGAASTDDQALSGNTGAPNGPTASTADAGNEAASCEKKFTCDDLVKAAFPVPGNYPGTKITVTPQVESCCHDLLVADGAGLANRWDCCANHGTSTDDIGFACTPWGPPVPPAMKPRARATTLVA